MTTGRRGAVAIAIVVLLAGLLAGAPAVGASSAVSSHNATYTVAELQAGGEQPSSAPPSFRYLTDTSSVFVDYAETNPILSASAGGSAWAVETFLGTERRPVPQNVLRFHYQGPRDAGDQRFTLHVVYWELGQREVERNGTVVTEPAPVNVTTETHTLEFSGGFDVAEVRLEPHPDDAVRVTMWIDEAPDTARWTFRHKSLATTEVVGTMTAGERLWWLLSNYVVWVIVFGLLAGAAALWALRRAGAGPQVGFLSWSIYIGIGAIAVLLFGYEGVATLWVRAPIVLAGLTVALLLIPLLEGQDDRLEKWEFIRPVVTDAVNAAGKESVDALYLDESIERVTELPDGTKAVVRPGMFKFLARLLGGAAVLRGAPELLKTEVRNVGSTGIDRTVWIHPLADEALEYKPEGFGLRYDLNRSIALAAGTLIGISLLQAFLGAGGQIWLGAVVLVPALVEVRQGSADTWPAPAHTRPAHVSMMTGVADFKDADTLEAARAETYREKARSSKEVEDVIELRDETLIAEALGLEVPAGIQELDQRGELDELGEDVDDVDDEDDGRSWAFPWRRDRDDE